MIRLVSRRETSGDAPGVVTDTGSFGYTLGGDAWRPSRTGERTIHGPIVDKVLPVQLGPDQFAELWRGLEATGLFTLPAAPSEQPPSDRESFVLEDASGTVRVIPRPEVPPMDRRSEEDLNRLEIWRQAKIAVLTAQPALR